MADAAPYSQSWPAGKLPSGSGVRYGAWMGEPGFIKVDSYPHDEFFIMGSGIVRLLGTEGDELEVRAGDTCLIHRGWAGTWQTVETTHKVFIIIDPQDASGTDTTVDVVS
ncbi:DUF861 domain-containing protein [Pseudomonas taiwanensis]|uniref:DUF861 domain-containing protein n=1 Tax=Pseudomonas taiwanensis TaxID=470150 RepID=A0ABR6V6D9_9PSED|nr:DUF861 domain-containing protein [Pseudomonas taiwanensis]